MTFLGLGRLRRRLTALAVLVGCASSLASLAPAHADTGLPVNVPANSGVCTTQAQVVFTTPIKAVPTTFDQFSIISVGGTCTALSPTALSYSGGGSILAASCDALADVSGDTSVSTADGAFGTTIDAAGSLATSQWVLSGINPSVFNATATLTASAQDVATCQSSSIGQVTLTGVLYFTDQTLLPL